ncbi:hypothetical protein [Flavobacterium alvei]|uniref:hypothetical protein n=1 Tax=Flavobacterium alvei TaxID=2080416 RepID=UPI0026EBEBF7|nr:hypothetical protein [Flavobacterium alvei]
MKSKKISLRFKNQLLLKCFAIALVFFSMSCSKDSYESLSSNNSAFAKKVLADPLFENLDKASYEVKINALKYGGEKIDQNLAAILTEDIKNNKITSQEELVKRKEAIGYKDYDLRSKTRMEYAMAYLALMKKYPELAQNKAAFSEFLAKNSKHQISFETSRKLLAENKNSRMYVEK